MFSGRRPSQRADEVLWFIELLKWRNVRSYLEIGARDGDMFHAVMSSLPAGSKSVANDMPDGVWGRPDSRQNLERAVNDLKIKGQDATIVWGDSRSAGVRQAIMASGPYDAVFIDGDHRLEGVTADWQNYGPMGRLVAFHDIDGDGEGLRTGERVEVPQLWRELKAGHEVAEFIGEQRGMGIGVVFR